MGHKLPSHRESSRLNERYLKHAQNSATIQVLGKLKKRIFVCNHCVIYSVPCIKIWQENIRPMTDSYRNLNKKSPKINFNISIAVIFWADLNYYLPTNIMRAYEKQKGNHNVVDVPTIGTNSKFKYNHNHTFSVCLCQCMEYATLRHYNIQNNIATLYIPQPPFKMSTSHKSSSYAFICLMNFHLYNNNECSPHRTCNPLVCAFCYTCILNTCRSMFICAIYECILFVQRMYVEWYREGGELRTFMVVVKLGLCVWTV